MRVFLSVSALMCLFLLTGCTDADDEKSATGNASQQLGAKPPLPPIPDPPRPSGAQFDYPRGGRMELQDQNSGGQLKERVQAKVGVGVKGRSLEDERMVKTIVTPAVTLFRTRERVVFEIQIPKALQLYEALNGGKPKTQEEFFEKVIKANQIPLPKLPEGERYIYDPENGELLVERPAK